MDRESLGPKNILCTLNPTMSEEKQIPFFFRSEFYSVSLKVLKCAL